MELLDLLILPVVIVRLIRSWAEGLGSSGWPLIQGTISSARAVVQQEGRRQHWVAEFAYSYSVEGEYYAGYYLRSPYHDEDAAYRVAQGWEGQPVMVRYHPQRHETSRLLLGDQLEERIGNLPPSVGTSLKSKLIYGAIACVGVLVLIAYERVDFLEKHAPRLNAAIHNGEITDESDGEYASLQIGKDLQVLTADYKGNDWATFRSEVLSREPALKDLKVQNDRFQRRVPVEKNAYLGTSDVCEQIALDEVIPALNNYTTALDAEFTLVKRTAKLTQPDATALDGLSKRKHEAATQLSASFKDANAKGCVK